MLFVLQDFVNGVQKGWYLRRILKLIAVAITQEEVFRLEVGLEDALDGSYHLCDASLQEIILCVFHYRC